MAPLYASTQNQYSCNLGSIPEKSLAQLTNHVVNSVKDTSKTMRLLLICVRHEAYELLDRELLLRQDGGSENRRVVDFELGRSNHASLPC